MGYLAHATERIHVGTGIMNLSPRVNHPVRSAERVAMLDHVIEGRFEWGTGRGAGSHEIASFNILDKNSTKAEWNEVIREIPRMWEEQDYMYEGEHFTVPYPHNILPKPYRRQGHPPIWVGCGNPGTFTQAGELGIGAIAFNFEPDLQPEGPHRRLQGGHRQLHRAPRAVQERQRHDDQRRHLPERPEEGPCRWPSAVAGATCTRWSATTTTPSPTRRASRCGPSGPTPSPTRACSTTSSRAAGCCAASPDEVAEQAAKYQRSAATSWCSACRPTPFEHDEVHEMLEVFGTKVIPQFDADPVHSTTRYRADGQAQVPAVQLPGPRHHRRGAADQRHDPAGRHPDPVAPGAGLPVPQPGAGSWPGRTHRRRCSPVRSPVGNYPPGAKRVSRCLETAYRPVPGGVTRGPECGSTRRSGR